MTVTQWFEIVNANFDESMSYQGSKDDPNSNYSRICRALNAGLEHLGNFRCTNGYVHKEGEPTSEQPTETIDLSKANISIAGSYIGPNYALPLSNLELLGGSMTYDNARGSQNVRWMDFLGVTHSVTVRNEEQVNVYFPNVSGTWNWLDGDGWERTGFNEACKWIQATF